MKHITLLGIVLLSITTQMPAQTVAEKKASLRKSSSDLVSNLDAELESFNLLRKQQEDDLKKLYQKAWDLHSQGASDQAFLPILQEIQQKKRALEALDASWQKNSSESDQDEPYALWHQPQTTVEQLVVDYGAQDFVYLIPPDVATMTLSVNSNLPIPRAAWGEMLELILNEQGIHVVQLSPYLKVLKQAKERFSGIRRILGSEEDLQFLPPQERVIYVLTPEPTDARRLLLFLEKFADNNNTAVQMVGRNILIAASVSQIQELLNLSTFLLEASGEKEYSLVPLNKVSAEEMANMLSAVFDHTKESKDPKKADNDFNDLNGLKVLLLANMKRALFLVGSREEVKKAEEIIYRVENQIGDVREKTVFWYNCRYSDPEELAQVLEKIYNLMASVPEACDQETDKVCPIPAPNTTDQLYPQGFYQAGDVPINPTPIELNSPDKVKPNQKRLNFIVDPKTSAIVMVVETDLLQKLKDVIVKLDVPKKMVQIEVLLFEKRTSDRNHFGLSLLRTGCAASLTSTSSLIWNDICFSGAPGILDFLISRPKSSGLPAFDLAYRFLISQDDVQINASPSVLTLNQTPARIAIAEEISINTGIYDVETAKGVTLKDSFTRAQYGIILNITPTIHLPMDDDFCEDDGQAYITLETKVNFDTIQPNAIAPDRPDVTRREIQNEAVIPDGQSVILGGLRRKVTQDSQDKIPFFGEIPYVGKLFCNSNSHDTTTEMFIMITPKIVVDPKEELLFIRQEEMKRRPGDIPEYLCRLVAARKCERQRFMEGTLTMLLGRRPDRCYSPGWHVDDDL